MGFLNLFIIHQKWSKMLTYTLFHDFSEDKLDM